MEFLKLESRNSHLQFFNTLVNTLSAFLTWYPASLPQPSNPSPIVEWEKPPVLFCWVRDDNCFTSSTLEHRVWVTSLLTHVVWEMILVKSWVWP